MSIGQYFEKIKERLLYDPLLTHFEITKERSTSTDGYLRVKLTLFNGDFLEFAEYFQQTQGENIQVITY